jgi:hypothetical protein
MRARSAVVYQTLVSVFWLTRGGTAGLASSRYEGVVDTFVTVFPDEVIRAQETWARRAFPNLIYFHEADRGGHFAMWEHPELFAAELRGRLSIAAARAVITAMWEKGGRVFRGFLWNIKCNGALVTTWWFASTNSISTLCGPGGRAPRMSGLPLASAQCHGASSTVHECGLRAAKRPAHPGRTPVPSACSPHSTRSPPLRGRRGVGAAEDRSRSSLRAPCL